MTAPTSSIPFSSQPSTVYLVDGPQALPPTITSVRLITTGRHASGIALTFSKPMAPATVDDVHNYRITTVYTTDGNSDPLAPYLDYFAGTNLSYGTDYHNQTIVLKAAQYDPSTDTVLLTPAKPLGSSASYSVLSTNQMAGHVITDLQGNPVASAGAVDGTFFITVQRRPYAAPPLTIVGGS